MCLIFSIMKIFSGKHIHLIEPMKVFSQQAPRRYYTVAIISTIVKVSLSLYLIEQEQEQQNLSYLFAIQMFFQHQRI